MTLNEVLSNWPEERITDAYARVTQQSVQTALAKESRDINDLIALSSPIALPFLEEMAWKAQALTRRHFGRTISIYAPLYLTNVCSANCAYCGFSVFDTSHSRKTLHEREIETECEVLAQMGHKSVLLLTGDSKAITPVSYLAQAAQIARRWFPSVAVEVYSMDEDEYATLFASGVDGVTSYMETYQQSLYVTLHRRGVKKEYQYRLDTLYRAGKAGARRLSAGILLGLYDWHIDAVWLALHVTWLQKYCWRSAVSISFPRLRHVPGKFQIPRPVSDSELVQMIVAMRLVFPTAGFNLSTRESACLRDKLIPLGITAVSAGSSTRPGGYSNRGNIHCAQFEIEDLRSAQEVAETIARLGYDPVWKDFDSAFLATVGEKTG